MWIFTKIIVFVTVILETNCKFYKGETGVRSFLPAPIHYRNRTKINEAPNRVIRWKIMNDEANLTATEETGDTSTTSTSTTTTTTTVKEVTTRTWMPEDTTTTNPPSITKHHHSTAHPNKNDTLSQDVCRNFKTGDVKFDLKQMVDVWQTVYHQLPDNLQCFKMYIKLVSDDERKIYEKKYNAFRGIIDWSECMLEVEAAPKINRKHFLQGINEDQGVMENIIIVKDEETNTLSVQEESADQWLVVDRLLLMRDCDNAGFVVFAKTPHQPRQTDIEDALKIFGEEYGNGELTCGDEEVVKSFDNEDDPLFEM